MNSCKECNNTGVHKLSCSQRDKKPIDFILDKLPEMSDDDINVLYYSVWAEISVREEGQ